LIFESDDLFEGARQSLWICVTRLFLVRRGTRGKRREKSEAEPREMRYQAEPVNEERNTKFSINASNLQAYLGMRKWSR